MFSSQFIYDRWLNKIAAESWLDQFYLVLFSPFEGFAKLYNSALSAAGGIVGSLIVVLLASLGDLGEDACLREAITLSSIMETLVQGVILWFVLASLLWFVAQLISVDKVLFRSALIVSGWAFVPFIFMAPLACFSLHWTQLSFTMSLPIIWSGLLAIIALKTVSGLRFLQVMASVFMVVPVCAFAFLFWTCFVFIAILCCLKP